MDLRGFRTQVGATQYDVAEATGLDQSTISRIEAREVAPSADALLRIDGWAREIAKRKRVPAGKRLTWEWLRPPGKIDSSDKGAVA